MTEYERDWHQEDKDGRAQGLDRDPEPPDDEELEPLHLDAIHASIPVGYEAPWTVQPGVDGEGHLVWHVLYDTDNPDAGLVATLPDYAEGLAEFIARARTAIPALLERLRAVEEELADWRGRERRYEYTLTHNETPPSDPARTCSREQAENAWKRPVVGTPWVRTISTSDWRGHIPPPF